MSAEQEQEVPKGSVAVGRRVRLPSGAEEPITVFINGVAQTEGADYDREGEEIVFRRQILKEQMGISRWMAMWFGLWGTYRKNETVDVQFARAGRLELASDLEIHE